MHEPNVQQPLDPRDRIMRYDARERTNHWIVAIAFFLAALSGLALFHPALFWLSGLFGGGPWTRILHPFLGLVMAIAFAFLAVRFAPENSIQPEDRQWLRQWRDVLANREENLPEVGRYNAGQKLLFWAVVILLVILTVTGFLFWRPWFAYAIPIETVRLASLLHAIAAALLVVAIIVHIYSAIWVKGSVRAMVQGWVSARWAQRHHPGWLRELRRGR